MKQGIVTYATHDSKYIHTTVGRDLSASNWLWEVLGQHGGLGFRVLGFQGFRVESLGFQGIRVLGFLGFTVLHSCRFAK